MEDVKLLRVFTPVQRFIFVWTNSCILGDLVSRTIESLLY